MGAYGTDLLLLLDPKQRLFDDISLSDSDISVLSDPFSERDDVTKTVAPTRPKDLTGKDVFAAFEFSPKLRSSMILDEESRLNIATMLAETSDQIRAKTIFTQIRKKVPLMVQIKVANLLNDRSIRFGVESDKTFVPDEKKTWEDLKDEMIKSRTMMRNIKRLTERERSRKIIQAQQEQEAYETMSGYWKLLTGYEQFNFSPPGFDAYMGPEPHWLETEPVPWSVMEESRTKVLNWFTKYFNK